MMSHGPDLPIRASRALALIVVSSSFLAACGGQAQPLPHRTNGTTVPATATPTPVVLGVIDIKSVGGEFQPSMITVSQAGRYEVNLSHGGLVAHDLTFDDGTVVVAGQSSSGTGFVDVPVTGIGFHCSLPGHTEVGVIRVVSSSSSSP